MNENEKRDFHGKDVQGEQAPSSLMLTLFARLGLDGSEQVPVASLAALRTALSSPEWTVRIDAVQKLERVRDQESFRLLLSALQDEDGSVRACAIRVLGVCSDASKHVVLEQLEKALHDSDWHVRETAVYALAVLGDQTSLLALRDALHDTDDVVRHAALKAIQQLQHPMGRKELNMLEETQDVTAEYMPVATERTFEVKRPALPPQVRPQRRLMRVLEQGLVVVLVLVILAGWFALSRLSHSSSGSPSAFGDADTRPLGKPVAMIQRDFKGLPGWSSDGRTSITLQMNTQKHELEVNMLDASSGRSTFYPVLDSSWIPTLDLYDPLAILGGRYLLALRAQGANQATLEIWDIIGQRAIATQIVPARISGSGQVVLPQIVTSDSGQKFATYSPDGTVAIWDVASGQKLVICEGKILPAKLPFAYIKWYNHDQNLLFSSQGNENGQFEVWNATTGTRLFDLNENDAHQYSRPVISPNNNYLALVTSHLQTDFKTPGSFYTIPDALEIMDAYSGRVLHRYPLSGSSASFVWLPDSQRLLMITYHDSSSSAPASSSSHAIQISTWNVFTNQVTAIASSSSAGFNWSTADGRYIVMGSPDGRSMKILQTSNGRLVATIKTPGIPARTDAFSALGNQYLVIGQSRDFYIWSIATGKLLYSYHGSTPFSLYGQSGSLVIWSPDEKYLSMISGNEPAIGKGSLAIWRMP